jgi:hypothetical protein
MPFEYTIQMARESACASQVLQQTVESMRIANWHQVTDANWLSTNLLNTDAPGANQLKNVSETLTLVPYGKSLLRFTLPDMTSPLMEPERMATFTVRSSAKPSP